MRNSLRICLAAAFIVGGAPLAIAATVTGTFTSQIIITADCKIKATNTLNFGSAGVLVSNVDAQADLKVQCTNTTPYDVGLNAGTGSGATTSIRKMTAGGATVDYMMYTDNARTINWGNSAGSWVSATGNGAEQTLIIYGRVPVQTTPAPATYTDTVTVTVTW